MPRKAGSSLFIEFAFGMWHAGLLGSLMYDLVANAEWHSGTGWFFSSDGGPWWAKFLVGCVFICEWCFVRSDAANAAIKSVDKRRGKGVRYAAAVSGLISPLLLVIGVKYAGDEDHHSVTDATLFFTALSYFLFQLLVSHLTRRNVVALLLSFLAALALGEAWMFSTFIPAPASFYVCPLISVVIFGMLFWLLRCAASDGGDADTDAGGEPAGSDEGCSGGPGVVNEHHD